MEAGDNPGNHKEKRLVEWNCAIEQELPADPRAGDERCAGPPSRVNSTQHCSRLQAAPLTSQKRKWRSFIPEEI